MKCRLEERYDVTVRVVIRMVVRAVTCSVG